MKIFEGEKLLHESESAKKVGESMTKLWQVAGKIKNELGDDGHYIDDYLSIMLKFISNIDVLKAVSISEAEHLSCWTACSNACQLNQSPSNTEYDSIVKKHMENHPSVTGNIYAQTAIYFSEIMSEHLESVINKIIETDETASSVKYRDLENLYSKIAKIVGENKMEELNYLIKNTFIVCQLGDAIAQEILSHIAGNLSYEDENHRVAAFKLIIDNFYEKGE